MDYLSDWVGFGRVIGMVIGVVIGRVIGYLLEVFIFRGITHIGLSISLYLLLFDFELVPVVLVGISSIFPDIDCVYSLLGKYNPIAPFMKHRGFLHTPLALSIVFLIMKPLNIDYYSAVSFGYLTHLLSDTLTPMGIMWLYPFDRKYFSLNKGINPKILEGIVLCISFTYLFTVYQFK